MKKTEIKYKMIKIEITSEVNQIILKPIETNILVRKIKILDLLIL